MFTHEIDYSTYYNERPVDLPADLDDSREYEPEDAQYERQQDELEEFETTPSVYMDTVGAWHYRGRARCRRSDFDLPGTPFQRAQYVSARFVGETLQCVVVLLFAQHAITRYEQSRGEYTVTAIASSDVKGEMCRAAGMRLPSITKRRQTTSERHDEQLQLWGWK